MPDARPGYGVPMTEHPQPGDPSAEHAEEQRVDRRADLLPEEEEAAGSEDPEAQAEAILEDSDARTADPEGTRHDSTQTPG